MGKHIRIINRRGPWRRKETGCGECQTSCQSACKTSCTVGNQVCLQEKKNKPTAVRPLH